MKSTTYKLLIFSIVICILCVGFMIFALLHGPNQVVHFTPPPFEAAAVSGAPQLTEADGYRPIDAKVYIFSLCGELYLNGTETDIYLTNPVENEVWLKAVLRDEADNFLGETGLIRPGEYVKSMALSNIPAETESVKLVIMGYEPDSYYSMGNVSLYTTLHVPPAGDTATP